MGIFREGLHHLSQGNWERIKNWIVTGSPISPDWDHVPIVENYHLSQIEDTSAAIVCKANQHDNVYSTIFEETTVRYEPGEPFSKITVPVVHLDDGEQIKISVTFELRGGGRKTITQKFDNHTYPSEDISFFPVASPELATAADVSLDTNISNRESLPSRLVRKHIKTNPNLPAKPRLGLGQHQSINEGPPIFLISIDTLRYDKQVQMEPLLDILGDDAVVPAEPRTQGCWTAPSHGSLFTGVHPGTHGYGGGKGLRNPRDTSLHPDLLTLPVFLSEQGYKTSGVVSHSILSPDYGFGRGFNRYQLKRMRYIDWLARINDAHDTVDVASEWLTRDLAEGARNIFQFIHVFDPHHPYIPPIEQMPSEVESLGFVADYLDMVSEYNRANPDYISQFETETWDGAEYYDDLDTLYERSIRYTANALRRLVSQIKSAGIYDDSLIIIVGDHGEEFGERGFYYHASLYDANIRPFMAIKPPSSVSWTVPDQVDMIDIFPTIAELVAGRVPDQISGTPLQDRGSNNEPRITERITKHWYNISIELDGTKGIFTFETTWPDRPTEEQLKRGPELTEFYDLDDVRNGMFDAKQYPDNTVEQFYSTAVSFVQEKRGLTSATERSIPDTTDETEENLEALGYL